MAQRMIVTGGYGFIGSNFVRYWFNKYPNDFVVNLDLLTYAGNLNNLSDVAKKYQNNYKFVKGDICNYELIDNIIKTFKIDTIINFAAESHNSLAILNPSVFFKTNLLGTQTLLEAARKNDISRFHQVSTCEVYGDLSLDSLEKFSETSIYKPNTPYNASKAAADLAVRSYFKTFNLPVTISNCGNNYGPYQFPEKLIPLFVTNLLDNKKVHLYRQSQNKREWIHVLDHCRAIDFILQKGRIGETYNVGTGIEKSIEEITSHILNILNKSDSMKEYVEDRPGHDRRYLLDSTKIMTELGWQPDIEFDQGIKDTVQWYKENRSWWQSLKERLQVKETAWGETSK